jgi:hypothetical protein
MGRVGDFISRCFWRRGVHTAQAASIQFVYIQARLSQAEKPMAEKQKPAPGGLFSSNTGIFG